MEWVAAWGGTGTLGAEPSLSRAFQLSLKGLCLEITLGEKNPNAVCLGAKPGSFEVITAVTAILLYLSGCPKCKQLTEADNQGG